MMQKLAMFALLLALGSAPLYGQNPAPVSQTSLFKDPNILWIAQSQEIVVLDPYDPYFSTDVEYMNLLGLYDFPLQQLPLICQTQSQQLKTQFNRYTPLAYPESNNLAHLIFSPERVDLLNLYQDANRSLPLPKPNRISLGLEYRVAGSDSMGYEIATRELPYDHMQAYKVNQLLYFDQKANTFGSVLISLAPSTLLYDENDQPTELFVFPFWLPAETVSKPANLNEERIYWARQTHTHFRPERLKVLKASKSLTECFELQLATSSQNYQTEDVRHIQNPAEKFSPAECQEINISVDTHITFHPETFEMIETLQKNPIRSERLYAICLVQEWYWDSKYNRMQVYNLFYAPVFSDSTLFDGYTYSWLLFYKPSK